MFDILHLNMGALLDYKVALWVAENEENINNAKGLNEILQQMHSLENVQWLLQKKSNSSTMFQWHIIFEHIWILRTR